MPRFISAFAIFIALVFSSNLFAAGYDCPDLQKYTSCAAGYYMTASASSAACAPAAAVGNACRPCSVFGSNYTCAGGTACPLINNAVCNPGEYLPANASSCAACTPGNYCGGGTYNISASDQGLTACPSGYTANITTGKITAANCQIACAAGTRVATANAICTTPVGSWYVGTNTINYGSVTTVDSCLTGYATKNTTTPTDHDLVSDCSITCAANYTVAGANAQCTTCAAGSVNIGGTIIQGGTGPICNTASYTCNLGEYLPANATSCSVCPSNYYCGGGTFNFNNYNQGLNSCPGGYFENISTGKNSITQCQIKCAVNTTVASLGAQCTSCGYGYQVAASGAISYGSYGAACTLITYTCPAGQYVPVGDTSCKDCPAGMICSGGTNPPGGGVSSCTGATYSTGAASVCANCPSGYTANTTAGKTSASQCRIDCAINTTVKSANATCSSCDAGYTTPAAGVYYTYTGAVCTLITYTCPAGQYVPVGDTSCKDCPAGMICSGGTNPPGSGASSCTGATYSTGAASVCANCPSGYTANTTAGKTSASQCSITCSADMTVAGANATCTSCASGYKNSGGTINYGDTGPVCSETLYTCPVGQYVQSGGTCGDCPVGSYCPGGTNPPGGGLIACPSGYINGDANISQQSDCKISCAAGTRVATANALCTTPIGSWYVGANFVNYGQKTNVNSCLTGYATPNTTIAADHNLISDCFTTCPANSTVESANAVCTACPADSNNSGGTVVQGENGPVCIFAGVCPVGYYCPPGAPDPLQCPDGGTSEAGAVSISECYKIQPYPAFLYGTANSKCYYGAGVYNTSCEVTPLTCDAGYYFTFGLACSVVTNGSYSPDGPITKTTCPVGYDGSDDGGDAGNIQRDTINDCFKNCTTTIANSSSITPASAKVYYSGSAYPACSYSVICGAGYTVSANNTAAPSCPPNLYTITLDKNGGTGSVVSDINCTFNSGNCALPATTGLTLGGYTVASQWCLDAAGTATCYTAGTNIATNISPSGTGLTLFAKWTPNIYTINLIHTDATTAGAPGTTYLKYGNDWYLDSGANTNISALTTKPLKTGYEFIGYYTGASGAGTQIIDSTGNFSKSAAALSMTTISPASIYVAWSAASISCPIGEYYTGTACNTCIQNNYCLGGSFGTESGVQGLSSCPDGGISEPGAKQVSKCYKPGLAYTAPNGAGTKRCFYTSGNGNSAIYDSACDTKIINTCKTGYWLANMSDIDCGAVGVGYYSPVDILTRTSCPNSGGTTDATSGTVQECFKTGLPYVATNGSGTQRCFYSSGSGAGAIYNNICDTKSINSCTAGYWLENSTDTDCETVKTGYYSLAGEITRNICENNGTTATETSGASGQCYKLGLPYVASHGYGTQLCFYAGGIGTNAIYDANCGTVTITHCDAGYYRTNVSSLDCAESGIGYYSPALSIDNNKCENNGLTQTTTSASSAACYLNNILCPITNGTGGRTCFYTSGVGADALYTNGCTTCLVSGCDAGSSIVGNSCVNCPANNFCSGGTQTACSSMGDGSYNKSDTGTLTAAGCYKNCVMGANATAMAGRDFYIGTDTCAITSCSVGYSLEGGICKICPVGDFCDGTGTKSCVSLGDGSWKFTAAGAQNENACYANCLNHTVINGTAIAVNSKEFYPKTCTFKCTTNDGNSGNLSDGTCKTTSCKSSMEMINGICENCARPGALTYKPTGNCEVELCATGLSANGKSCVESIAECAAPNSDLAQKVWDIALKSYGICTIKKCSDGYHIASNACVLDNQVCVIENGTGYKEWNVSQNKWGSCLAESCNPGFTSDASETNELSKPCGVCKNKFGVLGEQAASSYIRGCEIASCMYQGEMYNLEGNECHPICDVGGYSDETGTLKWNAGTKKCDRNCKAGFTTW